MSLLSSLRGSRALTRCLQQHCQLNGELIHPKADQYKLIEAGFASSFAKCLHTKKFSRNMEFYTPSSKNLPKDPKDLSVSKHLGEENRPTALLFCWLMCKDKHVRKYVDFYTDLGMDVLKIRISPFDLYKPVKGSQVVAEEFLNFLHSNKNSSPLLIHGFSVGAYVFCESMVKIANDMDKHGKLLDRFVGQIWDSPVDIEGIPTAMPKAITDNKILQAYMTKYLVWYLRTNQEAATRHYRASSKKMHECFVNVPGLFLFSETDSFSNTEVNSRVYLNWEEKNIPVYTKCWKKSPHVSHYIKHKAEYVAQVYAFLENIGLVQGEGKRALQR